MLVRGSPNLGTGLPEEAGGGVDAVDEGREREAAVAANILPDQPTTD